MIAGPSPQSARRQLRDVVQQAASCVTTGVLVDDSRTITGELRLSSRLAPSEGRPLSLIVGHRYGLIADTARDRRDRWQAQTVGYLYALDDADGREILAYHWHPTSRSPEMRPHLHIGAGAGALRPQLQKAHLRTGFVTPVALLSLLLESFGVRPRRADWAAVLGMADAALAMR